MTAETHAQKASRGAENESRRGEDRPQWQGRETCWSRQPKSSGRLAGGKRTIARTRPREPVIGLKIELAAEFANLDRPRPMDMFLQHAIDEETGAERQRQSQKGEAAPIRCIMRG